VDEVPAERPANAARCSAARAAAASAQLSTTTTTNAAAAPAAAAKAKCVESVRSKTLRAALPGFTCEECLKFYETMQQQGIYCMSDSQVRRDILQGCSRHKARWTPPSTPEGFWNLTLQTPDDWH
jgi:hypothetical protein